mmetsp:Transcript_10474/g.43653  ORF Transcript_10474/g.43653 Transcript_10474/m.43653 type:complete len:117 (+) Transcript_10474:1403-1753(+)
MMESIMSPVREESPFEFLLPANSSTALFDDWSKSGRYGEGLKEIIFIGKKRASLEPLRRGHAKVSCEGLLLGSPRTSSPFLDGEAEEGSIDARKASFRGGLTASGSLLDNLAGRSR